MTYTRSLTSRSTGGRVRCDRSIHQTGRTRTFLAVTDAVARARPTISPSAAISCIANTRRSPNKMKTRTSYNRPRSDSSRRTVSYDDDFDACAPSTTPCESSRREYILLGYCLSSGPGAPTHPGSRDLWPSSTFELRVPYMRSYRSPSAGGYADSRATPGRQKLESSDEPSYFPTSYSPSTGYLTGGVDVDQASSIVAYCTITFHELRKICSE